MHEEQDGNSVNYPKSDSKTIDRTGCLHEDESEKYQCSCTSNYDVGQPLKYPEYVVQIFANGEIGESNHTTRDRNKEGE